ncbi:MAG: glucose-6-phosphate isomerase [Polyangiales bacterium]
MSRDLWERYQQCLCVVDSVGLTVDVSRMKFAPDFFDRMTGPLDDAFDAMAALERGAIANPDEQRMVGHYWLRAPELSPTPELKEAIESANRAVLAFATRVHAGDVKPERGGKFENLLVMGIGGSALGPQLAADALGGAHDKLRVFFFDNTDPDGFQRVFDRLEGQLEKTLSVVISKSGGTKETRNALLETQRAYARAGLTFAKHAVAVTGEDSELDKTSREAGWLARFPMWDWVGGRTSELSAVGLLPAALQGLDVRGLLDGARAMDAATRARDRKKNPAALLALMWHHGADGRGAKDMVVLPYKDRLVLFSKYLQQLVMESLGKELDLDGKVVHQGLAVYGNKGATDQHAYVQQLREGVNNFFATFIVVRESQKGEPLEVEPGITSGDYLHGFFLGTRQALYEKDRESITISVPDASARTLGALIALYERTVGLYAQLVHINAYHQPGVEAGKKAATQVLALQTKVLAALRGQQKPMSVEEVATAASAQAEIETVFHLLEHLAANPVHGVTKQAGNSPFDARYAA